MNPKSAYMKALIVQSDLKYLDEKLSDRNKDPSESLRFIRYMLVVLENFRNLISETNQLCRNEKRLTEKKRAIRKELKQIVHLRNKVGGHIDEDVLNSVINGEPILFSSDITPEGEYAIASIRLLDVTLNTYIDKDGKPVIFGHDIDLVIPSDNQKFLQWLEDFVISALDITEIILKVLNSQIKRVKSSQELMNQYIEVGLGKFKA